MAAVVRFEQPGRRPLEVVVEGSLEVGRECDGLLLADERLSRRHLRLDEDHGRVLVTDLGSSNGTLLDGELITSQVVLLPDARLIAGDTRVTLGSTSSAGPARGTVIEGGTPAAVRAAPVQSAEDGRRTSIESVADVVTRDASAMHEVVQGDETVTIMFSDIESSTTKALAVGDVEWMAILKTHNTIFERRVQEHGGTIVKNQGDGYMVTFRSARRSLLCAAAVQADLHAHARANPGSAIRVRMGCHTGEAIEEDGDLFGRHVIIAARVANLADGAEVLVSSIVREVTSARGDLAFGDPQLVELKGVEGEHVVYPFEWMRLADRG